jgi:hypothetical protein
LLAACESGVIDLVVLLVLRERPFGELFLDPPILAEGLNKTMFLTS